MSVAALVLEYGGGEDEAIAALLHDAVEDQGGHATLEEIRQNFGDAVARIVDECTDAYTTPKPPWRDRKEGYLERLRGASPQSRRVSLADKLHNARDTLASYRAEGEQAFERFRGGREGTLWYYRELLRVFQATGNDELTREYERVVGELERVSGAQAAGSVS
jgi:GTP pyrophosphokinase